MIVNAVLMLLSNNAKGASGVIRETSADSDPAGPANAPFECEIQGQLEA